MSKKTKEQQVIQDAYEVLNNFDDDEMEMFCDFITMKFVDYLGDENLCDECMERHENNIKTFFMNIKKDTEPLECDMAMFILRMAIKMQNDIFERMCLDTIAQKTNLTECKRDLYFNNKLN